MGSLGLLLKPEIQTHNALTDVSFEIEAGSFTGLIGANGAGKTTLLKILSGLIPPSSGEALVLDENPFKRSMSFRRQISLVMGQKAQLWWDLPAVDAFDLLQAIFEIPKKTYQERLTTLTELLDVTRLLNTQIRRLSLGERMKMELIGALLHWPKIIFLDEPTIGLDILAAHKLREFLKVFNHKEKATIILTSHNMDDIERLCSRVIILRAGKTIYDGTPTGLTNEGERRLRVRLMQTPTLAELCQITGLPAERIELQKIGNEEASEKNEGESETPIQPTHDSVLFSIGQEQIVGVLQALMGRVQIIDMGIEQQSLEHVIQKLYSEERASV